MIGLAGALVLAACSSPPPGGLAEEEGRVLVHTHRMWLRGLDQFVTVTKDVHSARARLADGTVVSLPALRRADRAAYGARHGAVDPGFAPALATLPPAQVVPVFVLFDGPRALDRAQERFREAAAGSTVRAAAWAQIRNVLESHQAGWRA